jgi:choline dehydrogenase-like flavoprotein
MGTDGNRHPVDPSGRLRGWQNVSVADASVLPSTVGESPQETIMALSSQIAHAVAQRSGRR